LLLYTCCLVVIHPSFNAHIARAVYETTERQNRKLKAKPRRAQMTKACGRTR
jgi:hypothetical protein